MVNCEKCAIGKMRQKNFEKVPEEKSTKTGYRMYIDITSSKYISHWRIKILVSSS